MATMSNQIFERLGGFIHKSYGIKMPASKKLMLQSRLQKRLRILDIGTFEEYCDFVMNRGGEHDELVHMVDVVSTNKTDFFREATHVDYMVEKALPELQKDNLAVWSAGCSSGEEPYTLAMALSEYAATTPGFKFSILATDISTRMLEKARLGIYSNETVDPIPLPLKRKYLLRSKDKNKGIFRIVPEIRDLIKFGRLNFMNEDFGIRQPIEIIFCRNVIIYFDRQTQDKLFNNFYRSMTPGGYLFIGHSETLNGLDVPFVQVAPTIYRKLS